MWNIEKTEQLAKHAQKYPKHRYTLGQFDKVKENYKQTIKTIKRKWEAKNIRKLENLTNDSKLF